MKIVTSQQMRELDRKAIDEWGVPGLTLMENAGRAVADAALRLTEHIPDRPIVVLCGRGNNGGDGFVAARHLREAGRQVHVFLAAAKDEVTGDAETSLERLESAGPSAALVSDPARVSEACGAAGLVVDALLGTGLTGKARGLPGQLIEAVNESGARVLAVDVPSGLDADTGEPLGLAIRAVETVTMGLPKLGLFLYPGMDYAGRVTLAEIGFPGNLLDKAPSVADLIDPEWVRMLLPRRKPSAHKGSFGRVLVIAGSAGMTGAASLCAQGALRSGAGLVTVGCPASVNDVLEVKLTEAMTFPLPETYGRTLDTRALALILELAQEADVLAIGPGLSHEPETAVLVRRLVARVEKPIVIDADGINALADAALILEGAHPPAVLTPHPGEMGRLMGVAAEKIQARRAHFSAAAAKRFHATVVLKGARSIIADGSRPLTINPTGNPGMASGGTGDVLTGMVAGLIAQELLPFEAAVAATYLHGLAGDIAASAVGEASMLAGDLLAAVPEATKRVSEGNYEEHRWRPSL